MPLSDFVIVILAAGKGTRLRSNLAKVLHRAGGRTLVEHVVRACQLLKPRSIVAVVGHQAEQVSAVLEPLGVGTVLQQPQRGTGHAMLVARRALGSRAKVAIVLPGDAPLVRTETLAALAQVHRQGNAAATILSAEVAQPAGYGRIIRRPDDTVSAIVEDSKLTDDQRAINEINSSIYAFTLDTLWPCLAQVRPDNKHRELYLTDAIALLRQQGRTVLAQIAADPDEVLGCNTRADLAGVDAVFRRRKRDALMDSGVTIEMPETVRVDPDVIVGADTVLEPGVQLLGKTRIGANCTIRTGSILTDAILGESVTVKPYSVISSSQLDEGAQVGPFAHLRDSARMMKGARVGNFVEVKKSVLGEGVKSMHLTYLGDARIGERSNIGAGTITCNYDGVNKHPTTIGRRVFIGSDSALVAPIRIGDGAYVGAGSTLTENVPADALAVARGRQVNKPGWAAARRREMAAAAKPAKSPRKRTATKSRPEHRTATKRARKPPRRLR
jgi:bifunctional UDP-N-acetylglucosamine pyrophosphorylase/glucosamine-1-phosphate N-acetyltransferase